MNNVLNSEWFTVLQGIDVRRTVLTWIGNETSNHVNTARRTSIPCNYSSELQIFRFIESLSSSWRSSSSSSSSSTTTATSASSKSATWRYYHHCFTAVRSFSIISEMTYNRMTEEEAIGKGTGWDLVRLCLRTHTFRCLYLEIHSDIPAKNWQHVRHWLRLRVISPSVWSQPVGRISRTPSRSRSLVERTLLRPLVISFQLPSTMSYIDHLQTYDHSEGGMENNARFGNGCQTSANMSKPSQLRSSDSNLLANASSSNRISAYERLYFECVRSNQYQRSYEDIGCRKLTVARRSCTAGCPCFTSVEQDSSDCTLIYASL